MKQLSILSFLIFSFSVYCQNLPTAWEELTGPDFVLAVKKSEGVCVIPMGVIEKHGAHLPLGTDVYIAREVSRRAAAKEYCIVYPYYFTGQIFEAKHQAGTIAYSSELIYKFLDETCREIARNGIKKIILMNSHGGNPAFLEFFCQSQLDKPKDYAVYFFKHDMDDETEAKVASMRKDITEGGHADEVESSEMIAVRSDIVKLDRAAKEPGIDMNRLQLNNAYTGIWWYAKYPNHYAGEARNANAALGEVVIGDQVKQLTEVIKAVKADQATLRLQNEFFKESAAPIETKVK